MKSNPPQNIATAQKNQKKENALDIKSMSIKKALWIKSRTIEENYERKFGFIIGYSIGSKSNKNLMKSFQNNIPGSEIKKLKKENAPDIISKSMFNQPI